MRKLLSGWFVLGLALGLAGTLARADDPEAEKEKTKIVLIAGNPSHGPGEHEYNAGLKLLAECLKKIPDVEPVVVAGGWPRDEAEVFEDAKTVVLFMDGGAHHPMIGSDHMATMQQLMDQGVGLVCLHYAVEFPKGEAGDQMLDWLGGYYEQGYSDNPHNDAHLIPTENHPITQGIAPFRASDEWYYQIRFRPHNSRVTPILTAKELVGHDKKTYTDQVVAWATERGSGGRSFGFTGAHNHKNWGIPEFRTLVLNAILWTAKHDVPKDGVKCDVSDEDLSKNLDPKPGRNR